MKYQIRKRQHERFPWHDRLGFSNWLMNPWIVIFADGSGSTYCRSFDACVSLCELLIVLDKKRSQVDI